MTRKEAEKLVREQEQHSQKLQAAEQILRAVTWEQMIGALDHWPLFFSALCPATDPEGISSSYETLRQRAHEFVTNHRLTQIEEHINNIL